MYQQEHDYNKFDERPVLDLSISKGNKKKSRGRQCCVYACNNFQYLSNREPSRIHFFSIPSNVLKDNKLKRRWCSLIKRQDGKDGFCMESKTVICQDHFIKEQIDVSLVTKRWTLKKGVEPNIFDWKKEQNSRRQLIRNQPEDKALSEVASEIVCDENQNKENRDTSQLDHYTENIDQYEHIRDTSIVNKENRDSCQLVLHENQQVPKIYCDNSTQWDEEDFRSSMLPVVSDHRYTRNDESEEIRCLNMLKEKNEKCINIIHELESKLNEFEQNKFSIDKIKDDPKAMMFYTGFINYGVFKSVFKYLESKAEKLQYWRGKSEVTDFKAYQNQGSKPGQKRKLSIEDEFFIVLVRLKVGLFVRDISERFNISQGQFSKLFTTWINFLYHELPLIFPFPSRELIAANLPKSFALYPTTRIILDCTEVFIEIPSSMAAQSETWSNYKHHNTYKILVGVSPNGVCTFVSDMWGGRVSDKEITKKSGVLELLEAGDNIMADKGFVINDILPPGVTLNIPPFKGLNQQLSSKEVEETMNIAAVRIHVEREMGRIKNYHILDGVLPLSLKHISNQMFSVIAYLTNFMPPLVPKGNSDSEVVKN